MEDSEKKIYVYDVELRKIEPYIPLIKKYFGLFVSDLEPELFHAKNDPERTYRIPEFVTYEDIQNSFTKFFGNGLESETKIVSTLWLVANFYFGDLYKLRQQQMIYDVGEEKYMWDYIREDIIKLYKLIEEHHDYSGSIKVSIGGETIEINNDYKWFFSLLRHHLFPHCIPEITSVEEANSDLLQNKKGGRPKSDPEIKGMVYGVANLLRDESVVTAKAPKNLVLFIKEYITMMDLLTDPLMKEIVNENWIKSRIHQLQEPQLENLDTKICTFEDIKPSQQEIAFQWLFPPMPRS